MLGTKGAIDCAEKSQAVKYKLSSNVVAIAAEIPIIRVPINQLMFVAHKDLILFSLVSFYFLM